MNEWLIWGIILAVVIGFGLFIRYLRKRRTRKIKEKYDNDVNKINADIDEKVKRDTAAGLKRAEEIRSQAIAGSKK